LSESVDELYSDYGEKFDFYVKYDYEADMFIDGGEPEISSLEMYIEYGYFEPLDNTSFDRLFVSKTDYRYNNFLKEYIAKKSHEIIVKNKEYKDSYKRNVDCKLLELYRDDILTLEQLAMAVYKNCRI